MKFITIDRITFSVWFFYHYKLINAIKHMYLFVKLYISGFGGKLEKLKQQFPITGTNIQQ